MFFQIPPAAPTPARLKWWTESRFGLSLHWGLYSIPAQGEWLRSVRQMSVDDYAVYFDKFAPDADCCREWASTAADAGAGYVVLTAKHHDGFCLWDSDLTDYKSTRTAARRDFIREYVDALRERGIRVGLYYSLVDWHHPDYGPVFGDRQHPLRHDPRQRVLDQNRDWSSYVAYMHGQIEELLTRYGTIDLLYVDFSYWDFVGDKWGASRLMKRIRELQPSIIVNDRFGTEALKQSELPDYAGDFDHAEQNIPRKPVLNARGERIPWEAWFTINNSWCVDPHDTAFKSASTIIRALVNCVSKGGNLCLNVSPDARGHLDPRVTQTLHEVGAWLARNGESIRGCGEAPFEKAEWGRYTMAADGRHLYAHVTEPAIGHLNLPGLRGIVRNGCTLATGTEVHIGDYWNPGIQTFDAPDDVFFNFGRPMQLTLPLPDPRDTVIKFSLARSPTEQAQLRNGLDERYRQAIARNPI
jgi:alpha-L-fucosidase